MKRFSVSVTMVVEVDVFDKSDVSQFIADAFEVGDACGLDIKEMKIDEPTAIN